MDQSNIAPLAKRLAEENNVDWRQLRGSGDGGRVVERDVLEYLARVMAGEEAVDPTPEPVPEGMTEWPEADVRVGAAASPADAEAARRAAVDPTSTIDDDIFIFDDDGATPTSPEAPEPAPLWAEPAGPVVVADDDVVLDDDGLLMVDDDGPVHEPPAAAPLDAPAPTLSGPDLGGGFGSDAPDEPWRGDGGPMLELGDEVADDDRRAGTDRAMPDLFSSDADVAADAGTASDDAPVFAPTLDVDAAADEPSGGGWQTIPSLDADDGAVDEPPAHAFARPERDDATLDPTPAATPGGAPTAPPVAEPLGADAGVVGIGGPLARHAHVWRRQVDLSALVAAQADLAAELGRDEPIAAPALLVRAGCKALGAGAARLALAQVDEHGVRTLGVDVPGDFAGTLAAVEAALTATEDGVDRVDAVDGLARVALVVADLSDLGVDDAILTLGVPVLTLGRVLIDNQSGARRATLSLAGEGAEGAAGASLLARVADLLETPVRLLV